MLERIPLRLRGRSEKRDTEKAFETIQKVLSFESQLKRRVRKGPVKVFVQTVMRFEKTIAGRGKSKRTTKTDVLLNISSKARICEGPGSVALVLRAIKDELVSRVTTMSPGSNFRLVKVEGLQIVMTKYSPNNGGSYIPTPKELAARKATINIKNQDQYCLLYCLLLHKHKDEIKEHPERVTRYAPYAGELYELAKGLTFPMDCDSAQFNVVEERYGCPINVYIAEGNGHMLPRRISRMAEMRSLEGQREACNLLLITSQDNWHYLYITKFDLLCSRPSKRSRDDEEVQVTAEPLQCIVQPLAKKVKTMRSEKDPFDAELSSREEESEEEVHEPLPLRWGTKKTQFNCMFCLNSFVTEDKLVAHIDGGCGQDAYGGIVREKYPERDEEGNLPTIQWKEHCKQARVSKIRVYADFETIMVPSEDEYWGKDEGDSYTRNVKVHKPCSVSFVVVAPDYPILHAREILIRAPDDARCGDWVAVRLIYELNNIVREAMKTIKDFDCLPVFFHNLAGYDGHFITLAIGRMGTKFAKMRKEVVAKNSERFMAITFGAIRFLDSLSLLGPGMGLDTAVRNLTNGGTDYAPFVLTRLLHPSSDPILFKKGIYPYDYMTTVDKFSETRLPPRREFKSILDCETDDEELATKYEEAKVAWTFFRCQTLGDYHDIYLRLDVHLLADVFEAYRQQALDDYGLDPANGIFLSLPNFSWFAMLKSTGVRLEQLVDPDMYQMIEKGKRGGQAIIAQRYAKANNHYLPNFDETKPETYITYLDANNLYGLAMSMKLPIRDFAWVSAERLSTIVNEVEPGIWEMDPRWLDESKGLILEVDLEYPKELHDEHNDYPLCPEQYAVPSELMSPLQKIWYAELDEPRNDFDKLCGTLRDKHKYVLHGEMLRFYLKHGMRLRHIHRALEFTQEAWLEPYIRFNTEKRAKATTEAGKSFYKLLNNAVFGKTMENVRNRSDIKLITDRAQLIRYVSRPHYKHSYIFQEDDHEGNFLVGVEMMKCEVTLDKPIYAGISILDLSKLHMYRFHYEFVKPRYGSRAQLIFTDTDSLCYHIQTPDLYRELLDDDTLVDQFDFSETDMENPLCFVQRLLTEEGKALFKADLLKRHKKVLGKFKDETFGIPISEFVGLRAKCYSFLTGADETTRKAKGVNKSAIDAYITHETYKKTLQGDVADAFSAEFHTFRSVGHTIRTVAVRKKALNKFDDKRFILLDGIQTRAHGHWRNDPAEVVAQYPECILDPQPPQCEQDAQEE